MASHVITSFSFIENFHTGMHGARRSTCFWVTRVGVVLPSIAVVSSYIFGNMMLVPFLGLPSMVLMILTVPGRWRIVLSLTPLGAGVGSAGAFIGQVLGTILMRIDDAFLAGLVFPVFVAVFLPSCSFLLKRIWGCVHGTTPALYFALIRYGFSLVGQNLTVVGLIINAVKHANSPLAAANAAVTSIVSSGMMMMLRRRWSLQAIQGQDVFPAIDDLKQTQFFAQSYGTVYPVFYIMFLGFVPDQSTQWAHEPTVLCTVLAFMVGEVVLDMLVVKLQQRRNPGTGAMSMAYRLQVEPGLARTARCAHPLRHAPIRAACIDPHADEVPDAQVWWLILAMIVLPTWALTGAAANISRGLW